jgi:hypothetical protein
MNEDPVQVALSAGAKSSSWLRLGDGRWSGSVIDDRDREHLIDEVAGPRWRSTRETDGKKTEAPTLKTLLGRILTAGA